MATGAAVLSIRTCVNTGSAARCLTGRALQLTLSAYAELICWAGMTASATVVVIITGVNTDSVAIGLAWRTLAFAICTDLIWSTDGATGTTIIGVAMSIDTGSVADFMTSRTMQLALAARADLT